MDEGLEITEGQFLRLPAKEQNRLIFKNTQELKSLVRGYQLAQKIQIIVGSALAATTLFLLKLILPIVSILK